MAAKREKRAKRNQQAEAMPKAYVGRRRFVMLLFLVAVSALIWRAVERQVFEKDFLQSEGDHRYLGQVSVPTTRGAITDRNGVVLAMSTPVDSLAANPRVLRPNDPGLPFLAKALGLHLKDLRQKLARYSHKYFVYLKRRMPPDYAEQVMQMAENLNIHGLQSSREYRRFYPNGEIFAHVIGFTNVEDRGQEGLEKAYDSQLAGVPGRKIILRDGRRKMIEDVENLELPQPGRNLALSLDQRLQYIAYKELKAAISRFSADSGSVVVLDVKTGEVLVMVNQPGYNPNRNRSTKGGRLRNRAVTDVFEPGSTMKPFVVAMGLETGVIRPDSRIDTRPGYYKVGGVTIRDHDNYGVINITTVIKKSSNVGASRIALSLDKEKYHDYLAALGFGQRSASGFPNESKGVLRPAKRWVRVDQAILSYGYGISVTALQLAQAYAVLANDGVRLPVTLLRRDEVPEGVRVFSADTARAVRKMMETVVQKGGTATRASVPGYHVAGKTGTARIAGKGGYKKKRYVSLFAGMAPAAHPRLVAVVIINNPKGKKYYGGLVAAPVFSAVMDDALRLLNVVPDAVSLGKTLLVATQGKHQ